jgi:hypothetical protein
LLFPLLLFQSPWSSCGAARVMIRGKGGASVGGDQGDEVKTAGWR